MNHPSQSLPERSEPSDDPPPFLSTGRLLFLAALLSLVAFVGYVCADWYRTVPDDVEYSYVGRQACVQCHKEQNRVWSGSDHDLAMDLATDKTVLGDFDDVMFQHFDVTSRMYKKDNRYFIHTEGPDGEMADFPIKYVFGHYPLQQYMVEFDRPADMPEDQVSRVQVLRISWDTEKEEWFYLPPPDVDEKLDPDDDLHWTGIAQCWNTMCAECHSTDLRKNFDHDALRYHTSFEEIDVSCEACHGPGSVHVDLANALSLFWDRKVGYGLPELKGTDPEPEIQVCARCHSRRRVLRDDDRAGEPLYDYCANELLQPETYFCDGQIRDEVYVHGSFIQSKMYHKKVRCSDCHDPHSTKIKFTGNKLCTSCHQHPAGKYDSPQHHQHKAGSTGTSCVECHMPETTYMEVDARRDHSLRVPRPDLSLRFGTPNACTRCHLTDAKLPEDKKAGLKQYLDWIIAAENGDEQIASELKRLDQWSSDHVERWYPDSKHRTEHFADALHAAWNHLPMAEEKLVTLVSDRQSPELIRASALFELSLVGSVESRLQAFQKATASRHPLLRAAAASSFEHFIRPTVLDLHDVPPQQRPQSAPESLQGTITLLLPLLEDSSRLVRLEAGRVIARTPPEWLPQITNGEQRRRIAEAVEEYKDSLLVSNDRAGAHMGLAALYETLDQPDRAAAAYKTAMRVQPLSPGARTNLAALRDRQADEWERQWRSALERRNEKAFVEARQKEETYRAEAAALREQELPLLARDAQLAPDLPHVQYRYGLALYQTGDVAGAEAPLRQAMELQSENGQYVLILSLLLQKLERYKEALPLARRAAELRHGRSRDW